MNTLALVLLFMNVFYVLYVTVMGIYRAYLSGNLRWYHWALLWWIVVVGWTVDVIANCTVAVIMFGERPKEFLVTTRLTRYRTSGTPYQQKVSQFICDNLLDLFDPTSNHC